MAPSVTELRDRQGVSRIVELSVQAVLNGRFFALPVENFVDREVLV